jgi:hypothetical protein
MRFFPALGLRTRDSSYARYRARKTWTNAPNLSDLRRRDRVVKALVAVRGQGMKRERRAASFFGRFLARRIERVDRLDVPGFAFLLAPGCVLVVAATGPAGPSAPLVTRLVRDIVTSASALYSPPIARVCSPPPSSRDFRFSASAR